MSEGEPTTPAPKMDPEAFELRAPFPRAIRFRRSAVIALTTLVATSVIAIGWLALKPQVFQRQAPPNELSQPLTKPGSDTLAGTPATYGDVPKLGPALPGDLGRPILRAQERTGSTTRESADLDATKTARQQRLDELQAARQSGLLAQVSSHIATERAPAPSHPLASPSDPLLPPTNPLSERPEAAVAAENALTRKERFARSIRSAQGTQAQGWDAPPPPNSLLAGSVIAASLLTGLNSDLPGMVTAQVTQNVFDTVTGRVLLIPQGARLIGRYDSVVGSGQTRALVIWERLILLDGSSIQLGGMPATDASGYAGLTDKVDFHTWALLKGVAVATLLGVGSELTIDGESDFVEALREATQRNTTRAGDQITQRALTIQPTIAIRPGTPVRVLVTRDLTLPPLDERTR